MADPPASQRTTSGHLDASGPREVVFCHQCDNEWWKDEHGLICPRCESEATEIVSLSHEGPGGGVDDDGVANRLDAQVSADNDPRAIEDVPDTPEDPHPLHRHNPWPSLDVPDPEEGDVEDFIEHTPSGRTHYFSQRFTTHGTPRGAGGDHGRHAADPNDPANVMRDFQTMIGQFMGPELRQGQAGRSGPEALFPRPEPEPFRRGRFGGGMVIGATSTNGGTPIIGHRFMFTTGGRPRAPEAQDSQADGLATYANPRPPRSDSGPTFIVISIRARPDQLASILNGLFTAMGPLGPPQHRGDGEDEQRDRGLPDLRGFFDSLFNPANAVAGDAVYSQEALDRIISTLMEQHPTSNAPGPATEEQIAGLPKKKLDEEMLGPELKAECSVCMDDVTVGVEVVVLPCSHWFHEACARAWLMEHNTCPICRKSIGEEQSSPPPPQRRASDSSTSRPSPSESQSQSRRSPSGYSSTQEAREARLNAIRERGRLSPPLESSRRRYQIIGDGDRSRGRTPSPPAMPGGYSSSFRRRDSDLSESQRQSRRTPSGSDRSHRSSNSAQTTESTGSGPMSWIRRLGGGGGRRNDQ